MNHHANPDFWTCYRALPQEVQVLADRAYLLLKQNPHHPSLRFKKVGSYWSARIGGHHRALAVQASDGFIWFWIGTHAEYDRLIA
ncbi:MAG: hypothetical protein P9F19_03695 [Candidatus Contendobacter sp.]|nr:hypothetical protein [Candidatus Contendobacter sp.]MDG4556490.1 hypothetical protein [Candidatus Contendobacter sp.]